MIDTRLDIRNIFQAHYRVLFDHLLDIVVNEGFSEVAAHARMFPGCSKVNAFGPIYY